MFSILRWNINKRALSKICNFILFSLVASDYHAITDNQQTAVSLRGESNKLAAMHKFSIGGGIFGGEGLVNSNYTHKFLSNFSQNFKVAVLRNDSSFLLIAKFNTRSCYSTYSSVTSNSDSNRSDGNETSKFFYQTYRVAWRILGGQCLVWTASIYHNLITFTGVNIICLLHISKRVHALPFKLLIA